jgi:hypothetical protein
MFSLGEYTNIVETNECELKELCLKNISGDLPDEFNEKFTLNTQKLVDQSLEYYSQYIIPRYISAFINTQRIQNTNNISTLYIGIDDFGQITGIPVLNYHRIPIKKMRRIIMKNINQKCNINIRIIPCKTSVNILEDEYETCVTEYQRVKEENRRKMENYVTLKKKWLSDMRVYTQKMVNIVNDKKLREDCVFYIENECDNIDNIIRFREILKSDVILEVPPTPIFSDIKEDPTELFYWIVRWKDDRLQKIVEKRPIQPCLNSTPKNLKNMQKRLTYHRYRWLSSQNNLNYYVIKIDIEDNIMNRNRRCISMNYNQDNKLMNNIVQYWDKTNKRWKEKYRVTLDNIPQCLTLKELIIVVEKSKFMNEIKKEKWSLVLRDNRLIL